MSDNTSTTPAKNATSTPANTTPVRSAVSINPKDGEFMFRVVQNMNVRPSDVNWEKVASDLGYKNANTAQVRFGQIKKRMESSFSGQATGVNTTPTKAAKAPKAVKPKAAKVTKAAKKVTTPRKVAKKVEKKGSKASKSPSFNKDEESDADAEMENGASDEDVKPIIKQEEDDQYEQRGDFEEYDEGYDDVNDRPDHPDEI